MPDDSVKRLHVTPLNPTLLDAILNASVRSLATDVSFHSIQTFPENSYGFLSLPTMEADRLMKKLNGSILKGRNLKIQEATAKKGFVEHEEHRDIPDQAEKPSKRRKQTGDTIPGFELPDARQVKRGWADEPVKGKSARKTGKSDVKGDGKKRKSRQAKYTDHQECLFRTVPPSNKRDAGEQDEKQNNKKKSRRAAEGVLVHEFKNTAPQPTFVRTGDIASGMNMTSEFVEGTGWIDRGGNVKERSAVKPTKTQKSIAGKSSISEAIPASKDGASAGIDFASLGVGSDETLSSGSSFESSSEDDMEEDSGTSSTGHDSRPLRREPASQSTKESSKKDELAKDEKAKQLRTGAAAAANDAAHPSTPKANSSKLNNPTEVDLHHLESLFKPPSRSGKPRSKPQLEVNTQFSFFGAADDDDIDEEQDGGGIESERYRGIYQQEPQTPYTKLDLQTRNLRSGAPTPDTAAVDRVKFWEKSTDEDNDTDKDTSPRPAAVVDKQGAKEESDFAKWFWENRGDNNRAWKRRRREAAKEKRQKENRKRGGRAR